MAVRAVMAAAPIRAVVQKEVGLDDEKIEVPCVSTEYGQHGDAGVRA